MISTNRITVDASATPGERPWVFGLLIAPSAVLANGVVQGGVLSYLLTQQGMKIDVAAHWIALLSLPTSLYFLYGPMTDFLLRRRTWLVLSSLGAALAILLAFTRQSITEAVALRLVLLSVCLSQLVVAACGGMLGTLHSVASRKAASSFYQAGSMAFGALATWLLIRESSRVPLATLGWIAAGSIAFPALFAYFAPVQPVVRSSGFMSTLQVLANECKSTFLRWDAVPYLLFLVLPAGTGAAIGLLPGIAQAYGVGGDQVAWINGLLGALAIAAGSMVTAALPARRSLARTALLLYLLNALTLAGMALGPMRPWTYVGGSILYLFTTGCCYSVSTAVLLEFMGASGKSGSGRYSVLNGLINVPVLAMIAIDGWGAARWTARGLPAVECAVALGTAIPMLIYVWFRPMRPTVILTPEIEGAA